MLGHCAREEEVTKLMRSGCWTEAWEPELREHVTSCNLCMQTVVLKSALQTALVQSKAEARLEAPGVLWWRAQLRRRNAAIEQLNRPLARAQRFALLINLLAVVALLASQWRHVSRLTVWLLQVADAPIFHPGILWATAAQQPGWNLIVLILCGTTVLILGGITVYLATE